MSRFSTTLLLVLATGAPPIAANDGIVATVGDRKITRRLLDARVDEVFNTGFRHSRITPEQRRDVACEQLGLLIRRDLTILGGLDEGMELPLDWAEKARARLEKHHGPEGYRQGLAAAGMTVDDHRLAIAEKRFAELAFARFVTGAATVSDEEIRRSYDKHGMAWVRPPSIRVQHILLGVEPGAPSDTWAMRRAESLQLISELKHGLDFAAAAKENSSDLYRIKGGDLGWISPGDTVPTFEQEMEQLASGEISQPFRSPFGWHIVQVLERRSHDNTEQMLEAKAQEKIRERKADEATDLWLRRLRDEAYVEVRLDRSREF